MDGTGNMKWRARKAVTWARKAIIASSLSIAATLIIYIYSPSLLLPLIMADILSVISLAHWTSNVLIRRLLRSRQLFIRIVLDRCLNKPLIIVDRSPWYKWALERLELKYQYQRFGVRNIVERFFGYLKQRTEKFYNNINTWRIKSLEDYASTIAITRNLHIIIKNRGRVLPS